MEKKKIDLFVPGRLCLMGEHSDWAGRYRNTNNNIEKGYAIVTGIEQGIYASVSSDSNFEIIFKNDDDKRFVCEMDYEKLNVVALDGGFWSYAAGVALCMKERFNVSGLKIEIVNETLPIKKGLSSSAAICVLIVRAFNRIYNLNLSTFDEMNYAYMGEIATPSRCGRLDQACAFGKKPILMIFDGDKVDIKHINVKKDLHFVFADLNSKKDTIKILGDLNRAYPFADSKMYEDVHKCLGNLNKNIVLESVNCIESGNIKELGCLMNQAQENFDMYVAPVCPTELNAPILHQTLNDEYLKSLSYGGKGVGSQGDGSIQFLARNKKSQELIKKYLEDNLNMRAYKLTIEESKKVTKAIIPVAGNGTRMYPISKILKKSLLPIFDTDGILKPAVMCLIEELDEAGIEQICLVIDREDQNDYDTFFSREIGSEIYSKLSTNMLDYERKIQRIGKKITYIYQDEKLGLGHAVSLCSDFAGDDPVLLVLGDQLYKTENSDSCTKQLLDMFAKTKNITVSVCDIDLKDTSKYGILSGNVFVKDNCFNVNKMYEKPDISYACDNLYTLVNDEKKYFAVFGEYVITPLVFDILKEHINNNFKEQGEFQLTSVLDEAREKEGMSAFMVDGEMLDIGTVDSYKKTLIKKM